MQACLYSDYTPGPAVYMCFYPPLFFSLSLQKEADFRLQVPLVSDQRFVTIRFFKYFQTWQVMVDGRWFGCEGRAAQISNMIDEGLIRFPLDE